MIRTISRKLFGGLFHSNDEILRQVELIACDLDGTLLNRDDMIAPSTAEMIKLIEKCGVRFIVITRRHHGAVEPYSELIRMSAPIISLDGALIRMPGEEMPLHKVLFDQEFALDIIDEARAIDGVVYCAITPDIFYISEPDIDLPSYHTHWNIETKVTEDFASLTGEILEVVLTGNYYGVNAVLTYVQSKMRPDELKLRLYESYSNPDLWFLEVRSAMATKESALERLTKELDISMEHVVGIGDHYNDLEFCRRAAYVVAIRNAVSELKEIADFVTARECFDEGINEFLSYFLGLRGVEYVEEKRASVDDDGSGNRRRSR